MFKASNANQVLFLKNKLKDIKKGRGEDIQSCFMRINEIKNDPLSIGEVIADKELMLLDLMNGMCSTLLSSTMTVFQVLMNY